MTETILTVVFSRWTELHGPLDRLMPGTWLLPVLVPVPVAGT